MDITSTFALTPVVVAGVVFIQWSAVGTPEDEKVRARWHAFSAKQCAGKNAHGKYYDSKKHATEVIKAFKAREKVREEQRIR